VSPTTSLAVLCVAEEFDLRRLLKSGLDGAAWAGEPRRVDAEAILIPVSTGDGGLDSSVYVFSFGVAVAWGVQAQQEEAVLHTLLSTHGVTLSPLSPALRERDAFEVSLSSPSAGLCSISNDVITLDPRLVGGNAHLAVSFAVAQSAKLSVFETRVVRLSEACAHIPTSLAAQGDVRMPRRDVTRLTGQLFLQRSAVNLLSSVLDIPAFFWDAADDLQVVYASVTKYLEIKSRVSVLNTRYGVLESMLGMLQAHQSDQHSSRLEWIIIWLILIEILLGVGELWLLKTGGGH